MPWDIKPLGGSFRVNVDSLLPVKEGQHQSSVLPPAYQWIQQQRFDPEAVAIGTSPFRTGLTPDALRTSFDPQGWGERARPNRNAQLPLVPTKTQPILGINKQNKDKFGQLVLDELDPIGTFKVLTGSFLGQATEDADLTGIGAYLHERDMDLFGMGETAMPARLTDYALAPLMVAAQMLQGQPAPAYRPADLQWRFQADPEYWRLVEMADDRTLYALAMATVSRTGDPQANSFLVQKLYEQFQIDRKKITFETSGDRRTDYVAKRRIEFGPSAPTMADVFAEQRDSLGHIDVAAARRQLDAWAETHRSEPRPQEALAGLALMVPIIGADLAEGIAPIRPDTEKVWLGLTPDERRDLLGSAGGSLMAADVAVMIPMLSGLGAVAAAAKGAGGIAGGAYKAYDWTLRASKALMATGVASATATWALQSYVPLDFDFGPLTGEGIHEFTRRVDMSRPVSQSDFMGAVNALGFFSSGTFGAATAVQGGRMAIRSVAGRVGGVADRLGASVPLIGVADTRLYAFGLGGSEMHRFAVRDLGLDAEAMRFSANRLFMSEGINALRRRNIAAANGTLGGLPAGEFLDSLPTEMKTALVDSWLSKPLESAMAEMEAIVRNLHLAQKGEWVLDRHGSLNPRRWEAGTVLSDDALRQYRAAARNAKSHDDALARGYVSEYGPRFITELTGAYSPQSMRAWLEEAIPRAGGVVDKLPGSGTHPIDWWAQLTRKVYHLQFDRWAGLLDSVSDGAEEQARLSIMSSRHVFKQDVDTALDVLRGGDGAAATAEMERLLEKREIQEWVLHETSRLSRADKAFEPTPAALADHLEDIYDTLATRRDLPSLDGPTSAEPLNALQRRMEEEGLWTVGYKPVNEAGEAIATVTTRTGQHVQSRWFDYPLSSRDNVELGNRGWMANKLDSITRGFRTWRLMEYQKASLFRSLSTRTEFNPTQIEAFHEAVMALSRKHAVSPQAIGRAPSWGPGLRALDDEVQKAADSIFGPGPHRDVEGKAIDWRKEIGQAYRQAYRMNLTAGLTSHLKARFGAVGETITWGSDFAYVMWRFGMSPLFKGGELWESAQLNLMRRVDPTMDPYYMALYARSPGASGDLAMLGAEVAGEPYAAGITGGPGIQKLTGNAGDRQAAAAMLWYAKDVAEDHAALVKKGALQQAVRDFRERVLGGQALRNTRADRLNAELLDLTDEVGAILPGNEARAREILRDLDREALPEHIRAALDAYPEGAPTAAQLAEAADLRETAAAWRRMTLHEGPVYYRGQNPGEIRRIATGDDWWDNHLFVTTTRRDAQLYGTAIETVGLKPEAKVLREGTPEFRRVAGTGAQTLSLERASSIAKKAEAEGYDAVHFSRQSDIGTIVLNHDMAIRSMDAPVTEGDILNLWQHAIEKGWMPDDEALRVYRRLDELVTDLEEWRALSYGTPSGPLTHPTPDLTDPITGHPVIRDLTMATEREYETALRSLRSRRAVAKKKLVVPSVDDMAHRLEAYAEAVEAPRPIFRSDRVGPEDALPEGYTLDPAEVYVQGQIGPNGEDGLLQWIDKESTDPENRGMWHATTNIDGVLEHGLLSRQELLNRSMPDDLRAALNKAYDDLAPDDIRIWTADGHDFRPSHDDLQAITEGRRGYFRDSYQGTVIDSRTIERVENVLDGTDIWRSPQGLARRTEEGLSAGTPDMRVSTTTEWSHAETIASRMKLMGAAANGQATGDDIVGHFLSYYDDLIPDPDESAAFMARQVGISGAIAQTGDETIDLLTRSIDQMTGMQKGQAVAALDIGLREAKYKYAPDHEGFYGYVGFAGSPQGWKAIDPDKVGVVRVAGRNNVQGEIDPLDATAVIEDLWKTDEQAHVRIEFSDGGGTAFAGRTDDIATKLNDYIASRILAGDAQPTISAVQHIGADGNPIDIAGRARNWQRDPRIGPDDFELQFDSRDLYVVDPRMTAEPLADDEIGLMRQLRQTVDDEGATIPGFERRQQELVTRLDHMRQEALNPDPVDRLEDIAETAEGITANLDDAVEARLRRGGPPSVKESLQSAGKTFWQPTDTKMRAALRQKIQLQREEFPRVLQGTPAAKVFRDVAGQESRWADFLVEDRDLLDQWLAAKASGDDAAAAAAFDRLTAHAGGDVKRAEMDALYQSEEWDTVVSLWALNMRGAQEEAFATHFFNPYRSPLERSINHPVLGVYPASWALKTAREWAKFLFDNRSFGVDLRLGMSPAIAIANITRAQEVTFAQGTDGDQTWDEYLNDGPLGSTLFVFNLLMPGDWSAIPFPLSRTIRESVRSMQRGEVPNAGDIIGANFNYSGVSRDARLLTEMTGEMWTLVYGEPTPETADFPVLPPSQGGVPVIPPKTPRWIRDGVSSR